MQPTSVMESMKRNSRLQKHIMETDSPSAQRSPLALMTRISRKRAPSINTEQANHARLEELSLETPTYTSTATNESGREYICLCTPAPKVPRPRNGKCHVVIVFPPLKQPCKANMYVAMSPTILSRPATNRTGKAEVSAYSLAPGSWLTLSSLSMISIHPLPTAPPGTGRRPESRSSQS
jgi:hypothetical protein